MNKHDVIKQLLSEQSNSTAWLQKVKRTLNKLNLLDDDISWEIETLCKRGYLFPESCDNIINYLKECIDNVTDDTALFEDRKDMNKDVFIVYAQKGEAIKLQVQNFIQNTLNFIPHTLDISKYTGSIWDAFVRESQVCSKAIVVMTADDEIHDGNDKYYQSRPNVFIELGYLIHKCGLDNVTIVSKGDISMPTDISGIIHVKMDNPDWKESIRNQMDRQGE